MPKTKKYTEDSIIKCFDLEAEVNQNGFSVGSNSMLTFIELPNGDIFILDRELVGNIVKLDDEIEFYLYSISSDENAIRLMPDASFKTTPDEILQDVDDANWYEKSIKEFMGSRYDYNSRLKYNLIDTLKELNKRLV